jgi:hypothetical protein
LKSASAITWEKFKKSWSTLSLQPDPKHYGTLSDHQPNFFATFLDCTPVPQDALSTALAGARKRKSPAFTGLFLDKSTARNSLLVESTRQVFGDIAYGDLEMRNWQQENAIEN